RRYRSAPRYPRGQRQTRGHRARRTAGHRHLRRGRQRGFQCRRRARRQHAHVSHERVECPRREERIMQSFAYANPSTVQEAVALLSPKWGEADVLAGGTDLLSLMKEHLHTPKRVVNIKNIKELEGIQKTADGIRIGALVTMDELAKNADFKAAAKSLSDAAAAIPSPQIRHMGTVGGDLCQRPRCWYYRQGFGLLAMKDGKSLVPDGA